MPKSPRGGGGLHDRRQPEHRDPPDRQAPARTGLLSAARPRLRGPHSRRGATRRDPALVRWPDGPELRGPTRRTGGPSTHGDPRPRDSPAWDQGDGGPGQIRADDGPGARADAAEPRGVPVRGSAGGRPRARLPRHDPGRVHPGRQGRGRRPDRGRARGSRAPRAAGEPDRSGPARAVRRRVQAARVRGRAGRERERAHRLQHGERALHAGPHRRQHRDRPEPDAHGLRVPDAAASGAPCSRDLRHHRRMQHPVLSGPEERRVLRDRDQRPPLPVERAREQGDGVPARLRRGQAGARLPAAGAQEPHHGRHDRLFRAGARLRRGEATAVGPRQVRSGGPTSRPVHEVRRGGDGDRGVVPRSALEGGPDERPPGRPDPADFGPAATGDPRGPGQSHAGHPHPDTGSAAGRHPPGDDRAYGVGRSVVRGRARRDRGDAPRPRHARGRYPPRSAPPSREGAGALRPGRGTRRPAGRRGGPALAGSRPTFAPGSG